MKTCGIIGSLWSIYAHVACGKELSIPTHLTLGEKILLMRLARMQHGRTYVEIGSYLGASACFISRGIRLFAGNSNARLYCVDTWMNDAMTERKRDTFGEFMENTSPYKNIVIPIRQRSVDAAALLQGKIDFLFIDGDHSYEAVSNDIRAWFPKLGNGSVVVFHDYGWAEGVQRAVRDLVKPVESTPGQQLDNTYWMIVKQ